MLWIVSWVLYGLGDLIWRVFDQWTPIGMPWPIYRAYNGCMGLSDRIQGAGLGPWSPPLPYQKG